MALTRHGNRTGRAAALELSEQRQMIAEAQLPKSSSWKQDMADARDELIKLDPEGWEAWWDSDEMPDWCSYRDRARIIRARIDKIKAEKSAA